MVDLQAGVATQQGRYFAGGGERNAGWARALGEVLGVPTAWNGLFTPTAPPLCHHSRLRTHLSHSTLAGAVLKSLHGSQASFLAPLSNNLARVVLRIPISLSPWALSRQPATPFHRQLKSRSRL